MEVEVVHVRVFQQSSEVFFTDICQGFPHQGEVLTSLPMKRGSSLPIPKPYMITRTKDSDRLSALD